MAALRRTKTVIALLLVHIAFSTCDNENIYTIEDKSDLLRGSDEDRHDIEVTTRNRNVLTETESEFTTKDIELRTTTELPTTTNVVPEPLGLRIPERSSEVAEESETDEYFDRREEYSTMVTPLDEAVDTTLSSIDNVYKLREDILTNANNGSNNIEIAKVDTTPTSRAMEDVGIHDTMSIGPMALEPRPLSAMDQTSMELDDIAVSQRIPKTENSEPSQPIDQSYHEAKPLPPAMSKSSTLKGWLEDSWLRPPAGVLVPLRPMALNRALAVWNDLTAEGLNVTDIVIIGYDSNGVNWRSRHNLQPSSLGNGDRAVSEALSKLLLKYQGVNTDTTSDGTMRALTSAAKLVPYDSALFVVTDKGAGDAQRLPLALRALVEKRLKVYTIWTGPNHPSEESEQQLVELRNVSKHTEGDVLPYSLQVMDVGNDNAASEHQWGPMNPQTQSRKGRVNSFLDDEHMDILMVRRGGGEAISLGVPVENGVSALRIYIEGLVEHAVLYPPNDAPQVDLYNMTSVSAFSTTSKTYALSPRDIRLVFPGANIDMEMLSVLPVAVPTPDAPAPTVGVWHLSVRCDTCDYRLCVSARTLIHFSAVVAPKDMLKLRVIGPVASVRESVLIDEYGTELAKLQFSYQPTGDGQDAPEGPPAELIADEALPSVKGTRVYAKIVGRDVRGEPFVRLSGPLNQQEVRMGRSAYISFPDSANDLERAEAINSRVYQRMQYNETSVLPNNRAVSQVVSQRGSLLTAVQVGLSTRLYGAPGDNLQLHFEVTNFREQAVSFAFEAVGELRFLRGIEPRRQTISSGQTVNVIVSVGITASAQPGARDLITFTAYGLEQVSISAYVYVINPSVSTTDVWAPEIRHNFQGNCIGRQGSDCAQYVWSATVIARDSIGGLLRITSSPIGLVYDSNFIAGSREDVIATYRATCCAPRVMVTAIDAYGNANSYVIDISNYFTEAGIAAIVLGVFLLIALIVLVAFLIYWCVKRRKESRELPSYTTSRNVS